MAKRALVIGSQTGGLTGVHSDAEVMTDALEACGFTVTRAIEADATLDGIVERYRGLIDDTSDGDAAAIYYSGHGGRQRNALAGSDPSAPPWLQYLVPTDIDDRSGDRFRGLLAQELSLLQLELTEKSANVTTILDCCHSARMSRDPDLLPKANDRLSGFPWADLEKRWTTVRADARASGADSNALAVRLVACSPDESAFELADTELGGPHGALTARLVPILKSEGASSFTWRQVLDLIRPAVMDIVPMQRPEVEGPLANRFLFSTDTADETGVQAIKVANGVAVLEGAGLFGMAEGDSYAVVAPGGDPREPLATAVIDAISGGQARLVLDGTTADALPEGATAHPLEVALGARPVAVVPLDHADRAEVVDTLRQSPHVRVVDRPTEVLATVQLDDDGVRVLDAAGEPLQEAARPLSSGSLTLVARDLQKLARATHVRELGSDAATLDDDVDVAYARLVAGGKEATIAASGEHLFNGDRLVVRAENRSAETRFVSVLDVGVAGAISIQTSSEPDGVTLAAGERYEVGRDNTGALTGLELFWPETVPGTAPRPETFVTIVSDGKIDGLRRLEQEGVKSRAAGGRGAPPSNLELLIDDLNVGRRDSRPVETAPAIKYRTHRFDFVFHPEARGGEADEPAFELDDRPDPSFRLVVPRGPEPPRRVALRLKEITVHSNRAILASAVRIDAMVVTAPPEDAPEPPYRAETARFDRVKDGDRLPMDNFLLYEGPVGRFLDLAVWVARDDQRDLDLADLLAQESGSDDVKGAVALLAGLAIAAPPAALVAGSVAAVGKLIRTGGRLLDAVQGKSIGVYRTSLLPHERFGAGDPTAGVGRHPQQGLLKAQDMSFAFEVIDLDRVRTARSAIVPDKLPVNDVVVVLPGILGSVLQRDGKDVWAISRGAAWRGIVTLGRSVKDLQLTHDDPAAPDLGDGVRATRVMPDLHLLPGFWKIDGYGKIQQRLFEQFDFVEGTSWFNFPYDWRRDNRVAAHRLAEQAPRWLEEFRKQTGKQDAKLVLLGHSMGGLVARHFLEVLGGWEMTRALVTFGTPYRGSLNALDFLANGFRKGIGPFKLDLSDMLRSLTSVHQLLPTYACVDDGTGSVRKIADAAGLPAGVDHKRVAAAIEFHDEITAAVDRNGGYGRYQIHPVVGIFQPTRQSAVVRDGRVDILDVLTGEDMGGDGTVPRVSATPLELSDAAREVYATESHASLQNFDPVLVQVGGVLTWQSLAAYKGSPRDGFRLEIDDVLPPHEPVDVVLGTSGPVLNVAAAAENVDTGQRVEGAARLGSDGRATVTLPGLEPGVYRITGWETDGVGLKPVHDLVVIGDETSAEQEASMSEPNIIARGATQNAEDQLEPVEPPEDYEFTEDVPEGVIPKGDTAADRGWGKGWPTDNSKQMTVVRTAGIALSVRREIAPLIEWLLNQTLAGGYVLKHGECWGFANRAIRGTKQPSNHSWGLAVDLNAPSNPMTDRLITDMPDSMVALWKSKNFRWGGDYRNRKDAMHYEFMGTPDDARRLSAEVGGAAPAAATQAVSGGRPNLERGASGPGVRALQERLNVHGAQVGVDGEFGPGTEQAVKAFQSAHALTADGVVGPRTWAALDTAPPAAQAAPSGPTLKRGASGPDVRALQEKLNAHGAGVGVDGQFGPGTEKALKAFQSAQGLTADGIAGPRTWAALG